MENQTAAPEDAAPAQEQQQELSIFDLLLGFQDAPTPEMVEAWKGVHGDVFVSVLSNEEIFFFRALKRQEYRQLQEEADRTDPLEQEEKTVELCLLFATADPNSKAGTVPTLLEQILQNSNFVPPQVAMQLVTKL